MEAGKVFKGTPLPHPIPQQAILHVCVYYHRTYYTLKRIKNATSKIWILSFSS